MASIEFYWVLPGFLGCDCVSNVSTMFDWAQLGLLGFVVFLLGLIRLHMVLLSFIGLYWV